MTVPYYDVPLTAAELWHAGAIGLLRRITSICKKTDANLHQTENSKSGFETDIHSAISEQAFAKWVGAYWEPTNEAAKTHPDVTYISKKTGDRVPCQVRSTDCVNGHLIIRSWDRPIGHQVFVLATTASIQQGPKKPFVRLHGWVWGDEVYDRDDLRRADASIWVPQSMLKDLADLP